MITNINTIMFNIGSPDPFECFFNIKAKNPGGAENKVELTIPYLFKITYGCDSTRYSFAWTGVSSFDILLKDIT